MKKYQSKIDFSKIYNAKLSTFQVDKEIHNRVKEYCKENNIKVREFLEKIILEKLMYNN